MSYIKKITSRIDWDIVTAIVITGMVPAMIIVGAIFPSFFANY